MSGAPLHDLVIRIVAEYLRKDNGTLAILQQVNTRFYGLRDIFISQLELHSTLSDYAYLYQPYGWNKVRKMIFNCYSRINDVSQLGGLYELTFDHCHQLTDVSALRKVHALYFFDCD